MDGKKYDTTLVDLPTIIESQKTLDNKQFYKIADICQVSGWLGCSIHTHVGSWLCMC